LDVTFVDAINVKNNVINNKMVLSADDHTVIKLFRQEKAYDAKEISQQAVNTVRIK